MELNPLNKPKRKRTVNKAEWTKEKRKRLRIAGKEYINAKGEVVPQKQPGPDCKCRRRCYEKIPKATRMKLFEGYYKLQSHDEQNAYLFGLIRKVPIARKRAEGSTRRTCTFNYYIRVGGQETQVCVKALANIHGVGKSKIHILCEKLGQSILFPRDERGRHSKMPKKVSDSTIDLVKNHIYSILHTDKVCLKALANIHGVGEHKIHILCQKLGQNILFPRDERGRHSARPKKVADDTVELVKSHIYSIIHTDRARDFLKDEKANNGPDVNITQMHKDFLDTYDPEYHEELTNHEQQQNYQQNNFDMHDPEYRHHLSLNDPNQQNTGAPLINQMNKKKRKIMKDGRPEPLIRQWYYSKIFHDIYTTKEAIALRKKILSWKCSEDFVVQKPARKQRQPKKLNNQIQGNQQPQQQPQQQVQQQQQQQQRLTNTKSTNTNTITITNPVIGAKKIVQGVQFTPNMPIKKKQIPQTVSGQENMEYVYPAIFISDLGQIESAQAVNLTHAQPAQQGQIRTMTAAPHYQATLSQQHCTANGPVTISTGNLQALVGNIGNINVIQSATHYTTNHGIYNAVKYE